MIQLQANWCNGRLYVWGELDSENGHPEASAAVSDSTTPVARRSGKRSIPSSSSVSDEPPLHPHAAEGDMLRDALGDAFDSLLVSGGRLDELTLSLPFFDDQLVLSSHYAEPKPSTDGQSLYALKSCRIPTLSFAPADAVDLLTSLPGPGGLPMHLTDSFRFWSRTANLVLEWLAQQRFVPAIHRVGNGSYRGYWRVVLDNDSARERLTQLIVSMPPVCRSGSPDGNRPDASLLMENFLWSTADAIIRRSLSGDELAHAILEQQGEHESRQMHWLGSMVGEDSQLIGPMEDRETIYRTVREWLAKCHNFEDTGTYQLCFRLQSPSTRSSDASWRVTFHLRSKSDPSIKLEVADIFKNNSTDPTILRHSLEEIQERFREDLSTASKRFLPLEQSLHQSDASSCEVTLEEAYTFLRDALPLLESDGFGVEVPTWWRDKRPRVQMWLDLKPIDEVETSSTRKTLSLETLVDYNWKVALGDELLSLEDITRLADQKRPLILLQGQWMEIQSADFEVARKFLSEDRGGRITVMDALRRSYYADDLETGLPVAGMRAHGWIEQFLEANPTKEQIEQFPPPKTFLGELRPYQQRGLEWLAFFSRLGLGACLADDMGLGKTIQLIALWLHERQDGKSPGPTLLIVPMSLVGNWQREIERFGPSLTVLIHHGLDRLTGQDFIQEAQRHDVVISTYGLIPRDHEHVSGVKWYRIALDEAQNIKNPAAKQAVAIRSLPTTHRLALTGTPVENRLSELWSILDFLNPGYLGSGSEFRRRFAIPIERNHDEDRARRLRQLVRPFVLRRLKSDPEIEVDLPKKMEMKVYCNLTSEQAALYEAVVGEMMNRIDHSGGIQRRGLVLAILVKLKQICNHPVQFLKDRSHLDKRSGKGERLVEMLEEVIAEGDCALVFTQFREMSELLQQLLHQRLGEKILLLHGGTSRQKREEIIQRFQNREGDTPVLILSLKAGGFGLNLTAANHVFHYDRWWNPAVEDQATDRVHRIGQIRHVQVHKYICIGTLEERIDAMLELKRNLADNILGSGEDWLTELTTDELHDLFKLSRDAVAEGE